MTFGLGPGDHFHDGDIPWVKGEFTARFRRLLKPYNGDWPILYFDNGVLLEGNAWSAESAE